MSSNSKFKQINTPIHGNRIKCEKSESKFRFVCLNNEPHYVFELILFFFTSTFVNISGFVQSIPALSIGAFRCSFNVRGISIEWNKKLYIYKNIVFSIWEWLHRATTILSQHISRGVKCISSGNEFNDT